MTMNNPEFVEFMPNVEPTALPSVIGDALLEHGSERAFTDAALTKMMLAVLETGGIKEWCKTVEPETMAFAFAATLRHVQRNR